MFKKLFQNSIFIHMHTLFLVFCLSVHKPDFEVKGKSNVSFILNLVVVQKCVKRKCVCVHVFDNARG